MNPEQSQKAVLFISLAISKQTGPILCYSVDAPAESTCMVLMAQFCSSVKYRFLESFESLLMFRSPKRD